MEDSEERMARLLDLAMAAGSVREIDEETSERVRWVLDLSECARSAAERLAGALVVSELVRGGLIPPPDHGEHRAALVDAVSLLTRGALAYTTLLDLAEEETTRLKSEEGWPEHPERGESYPWPRTDQN